MIVVSASATLRGSGVSPLIFCSDQGETEEDYDASYEIAGTATSLQIESDRQKRREQAVLDETDKRGPSSPSPNPKQSGQQQVQQLNRRVPLVFDTTTTTNPTDRTSSQSVSWSVSQSVSEFNRWFVSQPRGQAPLPAFASSLDASRLDRCALLSIKSSIL